MNVRLLAFSLVSLSAACATVVGAGTRTGVALGARSGECQISVLDDPPAGKYATIGLVEARGSDDEADLLAELKKQACLLGATAIYGMEVEAVEGMTFGPVGDEAPDVAPSMSFAIATAIALPSAPSASPHGQPVAARR